MKTQISRESDDRQKRYSGVYQQQGRMITDADWGELTEIAKRRVDDALHDVIDSGAPRERGVSITQIDGELLINGTHLYADGVRGIVAPVDTVDADANAFTYDQQADFPSPPPLPVGEAYRIYADVWERIVTSLEDENLLDAGLHGADTATRTQTMAQIKWYPDVFGPDGPDVDANPPLGDAPLTVVVRRKQSQPDECDPCADVISIEDRVGNYLFRLELHDVQGPPNAPTSITLKWSSENGAEQFEIDNDVPDWFKSGDWVWEFFNKKSEKHLGVHLIDTFNPVRGELRTAYPDVTPAGFPFVRRWDGYVILERSGDGTYALAVDGDGAVRGVDKGIALRLAADANDDAPGAVILDAAFNVQLDGLELTLNLETQRFVAGDYWLAVVREQIHVSGDMVLEAQPPVGIIHHYVELALVDAAGALIAPPEGSEAWRKLHFPPLTDLDAGDVAYGTSCPPGSLFDETHDTVEKALDRICGLSAEHVAFDKPCNDSIYEGVPADSITTVKDALGLLCGLSAEHVGFEKPCDTSIYKDVPVDSITTVKEALALLCDVRADQIRYDDSNGCPLLVEAETVQVALERLCARPTGGGCRIVVGPDDNLADTIREALAGDELNICICLLPGEHVVGDGLGLTKPEVSLSICGCGAASTQLILQGGPLQFSIRSFSLCGVQVIGSDPDSFIALTECGRIRLDACHVVGVVNDRPLIELEATDYIHLVDNTIEANSADVFNVALEVLGRLPPLDRPFHELSRDDFITSARKNVDPVAASSREKRRELAGFITQTLRGRLPRALTEAEKETYGTLKKALKRNVLSEELLLGELIDLRDIAVASSSAVAVVISSARADAMLDHNRIFGIVSIYGHPAPAPLTHEEGQALRGRVVDGAVTFLGTGRDLHLRNNRFAMLAISDEHVEVLRSALEDQEPQIRGLFDRILLTDNVITHGASTFLAVGHSFAATRFEPGLAGSVALVIGENAIYVATKSTNLDFQLQSITRNGLSKETATLQLTIVHP